MTHVIKVCSCGCTYDFEAWERLPFAGANPAKPALMHKRRTDGDGYAIITTFELRNCPCGSTLALEIERGGIGAYSDSEIARRSAVSS